MSDSFNKTDMLRAPVVSMFFRYGIPWVLSLLFASSAGIVDGIFIGRHEGALALAAVNIVWPIFSLAMGICVMWASGGSVRCAAYLGLGNIQNAKAIFSNVLFTLLLISLCVTMICFFFADGLVRLLGADDSLTHLASLYLQTVAPFFPIFMIGVTLAFFLRVDERPNLASLGLSLTAIANMILDFLFIAQLEWGLRGAALATGFSYLVMLAVYGFGYFLNSRTRRLSFIRCFSQWRDVARAAWNGISEMINEMSAGTVLIFMNIAIMQHIGAYGVAGFTVVNYFNWFCLMTNYGLGDSLGPLISANNACKLYRRTDSLLLAALVTVFCIGLLCFLLMTLFPQELIAFFIPTQGEAVQIAAEFMEINRFMLFFCGVNIVLTSYFTGLLQATASAVIALLRTLVLPILFITILPLYMGYKGIAVALPLAEALTLVVSLILLKKLRPVGRSRITTY